MTNVRGALMGAFLLAGCAPDPIAPSAAPFRAVLAVSAGGDYIVQSTRPAPVGVKAKRQFAHVLKGYAATLTAEQVTALRAEGATVTPDNVVTLDVVLPWGLDRIDQRALPYNQTYTPPGTGAGVTAYILDTGIRYDHQEFGGRASFAWDVDGGNGADCFGHGTHVAGTVGGATVGVARGVTLKSVKVFPACTSSTMSSTIIAAMDWVAANATLPAVVNMSLGGPYDPAEDAAVQNLTARGIVVVVSAGNSNADACQVSPAGAPSAITVGATDGADIRASFSNWGNCIDVFGPGVNIISASVADANGYIGKSGTSMSSPHVAGVAALLLAENPARTVAQVDSVLYMRSTKSVVVSALSPRAHLVYTGTDDQLDTLPPPPAPLPFAAPYNLQASVTGYTKNKGQKATIRVTWEAPAEPRTHIYYVYTIDEAGTTTSITAVYPSAGNRVDVQVPVGRWVMRVRTFGYVGNLGMYSLPATTGVIEACPRGCR
jgi:subtilisin family serine protease